VKIEKRGSAGEFAFYLLHDVADQEAAGPDFGSFAENRSQPGFAGVINESYAGKVDEELFSVSRGQKSRPGLFRFLSPGSAESSFKD